MGAYTCEFGVVHKVCRCPTPHVVRCDVPEEHGYQPKHRKEPVVKYRITVIERERGWGQDSWTEDFDTPQEALDRIDAINSKNKPGPAPDYYIQAESNVEKVTL